MGTKYVFVTGGVASSLGKGIVAASLAKLLQARGLAERLFSSARSKQTGAIRNNFFR